MWYLCYGIYYVHDSFFYQWKCCCMIYQIHHSFHIPYRTKFGGQHFWRTTFFGGQNFRHQGKISTKFLHWFLISPHSSQEKYVFNMRFVLIWHVLDVYGNILMAQRRPLWNIKSENSCRNDFWMTIWKKKRSLESANEGLKIDDIKNVA